MPATTTMKSAAGPEVRIRTVSSGVIPCMRNDSYGIFLMHLEFELIKDEVVKGSGQVRRLIITHDTDLRVTRPRTAGMSSWTTF